MKKLLLFFFIVFAFSARAQIPEPAMFWLEGVGGNGYNEVGTFVSKTTDGGFIINIGTNSASGTGNIDSFCASSSIGDRTIFLKYNSDASILEWSKCSTNGSYIYPQSDGSFIFGGITSSVPSGWAFKIMKEDALGAVLWSKTYGGQAASARLSGMIATEDHGYIMIGETNYSDTDFISHYGSWTDDDIAILRIDSNGNKVWTKVIGGSSEDKAVAIVTAPSDGCYVLGSTLSSDYDCTGSLGGGDLYLARLDKNGNILWHRDIGGSGGEYASYGVSNGKGGIIIAGATSSLDVDVTVYPSYGCPIWALEVDSNKNVLWDNCYGGGGSNCYPNAICKATDGSIWIAGVSTLKGGQVDSGYGRDDAFFIHTDSVGKFINAKVLGSHLWDRGMMVYPLSNGNVIAGGFYDTSGGSFNSLVTYTTYPNSNAFLTVFETHTTNIAEVHSKNNKAEIYPNPTTEKINIKLSRSISDHYRIVISNIMGKQVYDHILQNHEEYLAVSINNWQTGMYYVEVMDEDGYRSVQKLIVE